MGIHYQRWEAKSNKVPVSFKDLTHLILENRRFNIIEKLDYGDYGLQAALNAIKIAIEKNQRIALYADYDVDGTMSCVSWIWFLKHIGFENFTHYIPCRFKEGYGVNQKAIEYLIEEQKAQLIITMDTGITANEEAKYCKQRGVGFICTDHHQIQIEKMPDSIILNPKLHPESTYQELCGCGITFVLLRQLSTHFNVDSTLWTDLLALVGMATICDVVPLNSVNHKLARMGVSALMRSERPILQKLRKAAQIQGKLDETDVGFKLGPRINAVGRLGHANEVIEAFIGENPDALISYMDTCNLERKEIQSKIVKEATDRAKDFTSDPILFMGANWHPGVVGIAASKVAETYWKPTWLFEIQGDVCKGSARSIPDFDVTKAMGSTKDLFLKFGGHSAAGGFSFEKKFLTQIKENLCKYANTIKSKNPEIWESKIFYDCSIPIELAELPLTESLDNLKPFGHRFEEPKFKISGKIQDFEYYNDKISGNPKHTVVYIQNPMGKRKKILFFNEVLELSCGLEAEFIISVSKNHFRGNTTLSLIGSDIHLGLSQN